MPTPATEALFAAYQEGHSALLVTGRSLDDFAVDPQDSKIRPLWEILRQEARRRFGMLLVTYSMAGGLDWDEGRVEDQRDRRTIESAMNAHGLLRIPQDQNETMRVVRGITSLSRTPACGLRWSTGENLKFAFLVNFGDHLVPQGCQADSQLIASELAYITAQSLALRSSGNLMIFSARDGLLDELVARALHPVRLPQPSATEKEQFLEAAETLYSKTTLEDGLSRRTVVHLTTNTPNRVVESLYRASHRTGIPISARDLTVEKTRAVEQLSEGTLTLLDTDRVKDVSLAGRNIMGVEATLTRYGQALALGDPSIPGSIILAGPPGTAKTDLAILTARTAGVSALQVNSPKDPLVGGTERKSRLQQSLLAEWIPNIAFVDEITEALPLERSEFDGDSGASRAVMASLLTLLSDESRRGRSLIIGTTNCPWRMGEAMRSRFRFIPVLHPLQEDFSAILESTCRRVDQTFKIDADAEIMRQAADLFYEKGANPRHIRSALSHIRHLTGHLGYKDVLMAAQDFCGSSDLQSVLYADLWALWMASFHSDLPWASDPSKYPFPMHLRDIVDQSSGEVSRKKLWDRITELRPHANV